MSLLEVGCALVTINPKINPAEVYFLVDVQVTGILSSVGLRHLLHCGSAIPQASAQTFLCPGPLWLSGEAFSEYF